MSRAMREEDIRPKPLLDEFFVRLRRDADRVAAGRAQFVDVACPMCGEPDGEAAFEKDGFPYAFCRACESIFASPRPTPAALADFAANSEAVRYWSTHFYRQTAAARREQMFRPRAAMIGDLVARGLAPPGRFVDIGAGYGLFLEELRTLGLFEELLGLEPDPALAEICRAAGFRVLQQPVEALEAEGLAADMAAAFEVLEHVFEPLAFLRAARRVLRPGGLLVFTTLTISGFDLQVLWERSRSITPPQHLNFGSVTGMERLIMRAGLEIVEVSTPGRLDVEIVKNRLEADPALPIPRFARALAQSPPQTREAFQRFLAEHRLSSHIQCLVRNPG